MILYHLPISLYSAKVRMALAIKEIVIEMREPAGGSYRSAAYRTLVPAGTVPALLDGDLMLTESDAIIEYVDETYPGPRLLPGDTRLRARVRMLSRYHDLHLEPHIRRLFGQVDKPIGARMPLPEDQERLQEKLALIEISADPKGPFLTGAAPSMADCGLAASLAWLAELPPALGFSVALPPRIGRVGAALETIPKIGQLAAAYRVIVRNWVDRRASSID